MTENIYSLLRTLIITIGVCFIFRACLSGRDSSVPLVEVKTACDSGACLSNGADVMEVEVCLIPGRENCRSLGHYLLLFRNQIIALQRGGE